MGMNGFRSTLVVFYLLQPFQGYNFVFLKSPLEILPHFFFNRFRAGIKELSSDILRNRINLRLYILMVHIDSRIKIRLKSIIFRRKLWKP